MNMNMDSSSQNQQNWLAFSLSNTHHMPTSDSTTDSSQLSLFEAFNNHNSNPSCSSLLVRGAEEHGSAGGGPKLEDFLGGSAGGSVTNNDQVYSAELKDIAASFLRGYSTSTTQQNDDTSTTATRQQMAVVQQPEKPAKKAVDNFGQRTSIYRGVTRHRWTGRYEAHLWDNSCRREGQSRKGRQVYLGGYDKEDKAARAYDLAALKYWGPTTTTNFPVSNYEKELEEMKNMTRQEFVASLRRKSSGFSRGASIYRGVTRHHQHGRWQARIGRVAGNKDLYLGTFCTQEEAAEAYDIAAIKFRGLNAVTNFDMSRYDVKSIATSNLPIGGMTNTVTTTTTKPKTSSAESSNSENNNHHNTAVVDVDGNSCSISIRSDGVDFSSPQTSVSFVSPQPSTASTLSFGLPIKQDPSDFWSVFGYPNTSINPAKNPYHQGTTTTTTGLLSSGVDSNGYFNASSPSEPLLATRIAVNGNHGSPYPFNDGSASSAVNVTTTWMSPPPVHSFQPAKPNLSVFQAPIFGME